MSCCHIHKDPVGCSLRLASHGKQSIIHPSIKIKPENQLKHVNVHVLAFITGTLFFNLHVHPVTHLGADEYNSWLLQATEGNMSSAGKSFIQRQINAHKAEGGKRHRGKGPQRRKVLDSTPAQERWII